MHSSRILVVYYSRTGTTRAVASAIRAELGCAMEPLVEEGAPGTLRSFFRELFGRRASSIRAIHSDLRAYDLVVIGTPVSNASMSGPVEAFIARHRDELPNVALFCTHEGVGSARAARRVGQACGCPTLLTLDVRDREVEEHSIAVKVRTFAASLQGMTPSSPPPPPAADSRPPPRDDDPVSVVRLVSGARADEAAAQA